MARLIFEDGNPVIIDRWDADDIQSVAENSNLGCGDRLTDAQVIQVMELIVLTHDANHGINWDVIASAIDSLFGDSEAT